MSSFRITPCLSLATALCCATLAGQAYADRFTLVGGGELEGTLLNKQQTPRTVYQIETAQGVKVTLPAEQVREVVRQSAAEREYEQLAPTFGNNVEEQWKLAQWCQQQKLKAQREVHLRRILELDTDHVAARHALGYVQLRGVWSTTAEDRSALGYVLFRGDWRTPQDVALIEQREKQQKISKEWLAKLKRWRLAGEFAQIAAVRDAAAIPALCEMLRLERIYEAKSVYLDVLAAIGSAEAIQALIYVSLNDPDVEVFHNCAEILERLSPPQAREAYLEALKNANNVRINRAAYMLAQLGETSAISPLIDVLVTTHKVVIGPTGRGAAEAVSTGFSGDGGTSYQGGSSTKVFWQTAQNQEVLDALSKLSGVTFGYDTAAWRRWHNAQRSQGGPKVQLRK